MVRHWIQRADAEVVVFHIPGTPPSGAAFPYSAWRVLRWPKVQTLPRAGILTAHHDANHNDTATKT